MYEADELCGRVAVISGGRIVAEGTPASLKANIADRTMVEVEAIGVDEGLLERIRALPGVSSVVVEEGAGSQTVLVQSSLGVRLIQPLIGLLTGVTVIAVTAREPTLEDAYVALVEAG